MLPLVSCDVWGTLLERRCGPDEVKLFTCNAMRLLHPDLCTRAWRDPHHLLKSRNAIELELAANSRDKGHGGFFSLQDVLRLLWLRIAGKLLDDAALQRVVDEFVQVELEQERFVSYPAAGVFGLLSQHAGKRLAFTTASSLRADEISLLLHFHGLSHCADLGVTTADLAVENNPSTLFELARSRFDADPSEWEHYGDVAAARKLGAFDLGIAVRASNLPQARGDPGFKSSPWLEPASGPATAGSFTIGSSGSSPGKSTSDNSAVADEMRRIGTAAAPLFVGFALWTLEQALQNKSEHVYFFTREGHFFAQVYEAVTNVYDSGIPGPPYSVLSVSRLSTFAPALNDLQAGELADMWDLYKPQSVAGLFATLGIETLYDDKELDLFGLSIVERIEQPKTDPRLRALLAHPPFRDRVFVALGEMRARLMAYLASEGLDHRRRTISTVDIGWRGSIQSNIARLYPSTTFHGLYLGLDQRKLTGGTNTTKSAYAVDLQRSNRNSDLVTYVAPMEFLCGTLFGSTVGYSFESPPEPIRMSVDPRSQAAFLNVVAPFQAGVLAGAAECAREMRDRSRASKDLLPDALKAWRTLVRYPTQSMADGFAETTIDETFGFGRQFRVPRDGAIVRDTRGFATGPSVATIAQDTVRSIPWPQAFVRYAHTNRVLKHLMPAAVRVARSSRRILSRIRGATDKMNRRE